MTTTTTHLLGILPTDFTTLPVDPLTVDPEVVLGVTLQWAGTDRIAAWNFPADQAHTWAEQLREANRRNGTVATVRVYGEALYPEVLEAMNATL